MLTLLYVCAGSIAHNRHTYIFYETITLRIRILNSYLFAVVEMPHSHAQRSRVVYAASVLLCVFVYVRMHVRLRSALGVIGV